jgi:AraC-like DNA-binding protein
MIRGEHAPDWAQIGADCGYYDQAHLIREFKQFAGMTPGQYASRLRPGDAKIMEPAGEGVISYNTASLVSATLNRRRRTS